VHRAASVDLKNFQELFTANPATGGRSKMKNCSGKILGEVRLDGFPIAKV
jgi:hypothetical protein